MVLAATAKRIVDRRTFVDVDDDHDDKYDDPGDVSHWDPLSLMREVEVPPVLGEPSGHPDWA